MQEWVSNQLKREDDLTKLLRVNKSGPVGFCKPDLEPRGQVVAVAVLPEVHIGDKSFVPQVRIVEAYSGEIVFIEGGMNAPVSVDDAKKLLSPTEKKGLARAANRATKRKVEKLKAAQNLS